MLFLQGNKEGSFLWMVKRDPPSYFFGTIHVPYTRVWEHIPNNTKRAFRLSDNVFFELDLTDPYTVSALTTCQLLSRVSPPLRRQAGRQAGRQRETVRDVKESSMDM